MVSKLYQSARDTTEAALRLFKSKPNRLLCLVALCMLCVEFFGWQAPFYRLIAPFFPNIQYSDLAFYAQIYTTASFAFFLILIPLIFLKLNGEHHWSQLGLKRPAAEDALPYLAFGLLMTPVLLIVCAQPGFYGFYPIYKPKQVSDWLSFEAVYALQFIAIEFFFRGPLLFLLYRSLKDSAIFIMLVPYALIHIHKPFPEALGAIVAGVILGALAIKSRSIWWGVLLHIYIALLADTLGLFYSGRLADFFQ